MQEEIPPDSAEKKVRLGCGVVAGLALGLSLGFVSMQLAGASLWVFAGIFAIVFALLALRYGDRFWLAVIKVLRGAS